MSVVTMYASAKFDRLCEKFGLEDLDIEAGSWSVSHCQGDHFYPKEVRLSLNNLINAAASQEMWREHVFLKMWSPYLDGEMAIEEQSFDVVSHIDEMVCDFFYNVTSAKNQYDKDVAEDANEALSINIAAFCENIALAVASEIEETSREIYDVLSDMLLAEYTGNDNTPVRVKKTQNFIVEVYEEDTDIFFEPYHYDYEYVIECVEAFKGGNLQAFDLKVLVKDRESEEVISEACLGGCTRSTKTKAGFSEHVMDLVREVITDAKKSLKSLTNNADVA